MLNPISVCDRASQILAAQSAKQDLSPQARAVITALCEQLNSELLLDRQAIVKMENAVKTNGSKMVRPSIEEIKFHGAKIGLPESECEKFFDHFEANGWKVGVAKTPMKIWTAALSNWKRTWLERNPRYQANGEVSFRDVKNMCREKWGDDERWMNWAASFYNHWAKRKWLRADGTKIDWQVELPAQVARWRKGG